MRSMTTKYLVLVIFFISAFIISCHKEDAPPNQNVSYGKATNTYSGDFVYDYFDLMCKISKSTNGFFPPQVARAYGYVGIAAYEAVVNGISGAQSLGGQLNNFPYLQKPLINQEYNWAISSNAAIAEMIRMMFDKNLYATNRSSIDSMESVTLASLSSGVNDNVKTMSIQFGKNITSAVYQYSINDGGHQSYLDPFQLPYTLPPDSSCWVPTGALKTPISPKWGDNRPFLQNDIDKTSPEAYLPFTSVTGSDFYNQAMQVYNQVKNNTQEDIATAKYWADDPFNTCTPTGHTFNILTQLLQESNASLEKISVAYAKLSIAENDAFIVCWKCKYQKPLLRPGTYIKKYIDPNFQTVIGTPAFPSYVSGHSCEIGAGSKVFINLFTNGNGDYSFTDASQLQFGFAPRNYTNFNALADECAASRFYAGIHYPMDNDKGLICGRAVGDNVNNLIHWPVNIK
ncbi:MAG: vanadium-dependent haloperoxidase [Bacteroidota bacterium]|nr:vanadium-dependent haloperoxidase [Bacteroidota bacterium]